MTLVLTVVFNVFAIGRKVKLLGVILKIVFLKKVFEFLPGGKLNAAGAVDVDVPPARLLPMLALLQLPLPAVRQCVIFKLENFWKMSRPPSYLDVAMRNSGLTVAG